MKKIRVWDMETNKETFLKPIIAQRVLRHNNYENGGRYLAEEDFHKHHKEVKETKKQKPEKIKDED